MASKPKRRKRNAFCQETPPYLVYLQNILNKYPDGGQILKELIQNADDAGASKVIFVLDERDYGTEMLYSNELADFQGPALLAYNNATFSDSDWEGIQSTGKSIKLKDPNTVGRFGLGFSSVYHITDVPAILSGKYLGMFDPQRTAFENGGFRWILEDNEDQLKMKALTDQFLPFCKALSAINGDRWDTVINSGFFHGTLFRFPLRLGFSKISDNLYSSERVQELFGAFRKDAIINLLFLRNVTEVALKIIGCDDVVKDLMTVTVTSEDNDTFQSIDVSSSKLLSSLKVKVTTLKGQSRMDEVCRWLVVGSRIKEGSFQDLEDLANRLNNIPTISIAYSLEHAGSTRCEGRLSCFLPLPDREENRTQLPVHINASFDLTDDRRSIKWVEADQQDDSAQWNHLLVEKILPLVYCQAVQAVVSFVKSSDGLPTLAYGIWPDPSQTQHKERWHWLTERIVKELLDMEVLCCTADHTQWLKAPDAIFLPVIEERTILDALEELLVCVREPLVKVPPHVIGAIHLAASKSGGVKTATPPFIRRILKQGLWSSLQHTQKLLILEYIISDEQYKDMLGLQLLPLSDGTFIMFQDTDQDGLAFIECPRFPRILLPGLVQRFVPSDLKPGVLQHLRKIGEKRLFSNLLCLDKEVITKNLQKALPANWRSGSNKVSWNPGVSHQPPKEWLHAFWNFLQQDADALTPFEGHHLVPLSPIHKNYKQVQLARLTKRSSLLFHTQDGHRLEENATNVIEAIGCTVIRQWDAQLWHKCLSEYIMTPTPNNILKSVSNLGVDKVLTRLKKINSEQKKLLCDFLSQASCLSTDECRVLSQLPIFSNMSSLKSPGSELVAAANARAVDKLTVPAIPRDLVLPEMLLICRDESDRRLLQQMEVAFISATDVAYLSAQAIKSGLYAHQQSKAEDIMLWVLRNATLLFSQKMELRECCRSLLFIPCNEKLVQPSAFFDSRMKIFQDLFPPYRFPPQCYQEPVVLDSLNSLGMKDSIEDITSDDILQIAEELDKDQHRELQDGELQVLEKKSRALVKVCNETQVLSTFEQNRLQSLCSLAWVPWSSHNSKIVFLKPLQLRSMMHSTLVQLAMPLTDEFNQQASENLGLNNSPPAEKVIENLTALSHQYQTEDCYSLVLKVHNIYKHVQNNVCQFLTVLKDMKIWNGDGFSDTNEILLSYPEGLDLSCKIKKVPQEFLMYRTVFLKAGVRETISEEEVTNMLHELMQVIHNRSSGCGTNGELKLALCILDWMKRREYHSTDTLPVPVQTGNNGFTLKPLSTTLFCDMPKECLNDLGDELVYNIVHEDITFATVMFLKVPLLSTKFLKPEYFEPWGPSEPITLRIKNILKEYSEEVDLFKEMIQNADDAGATICNFLVDMRQNLDFRNSLIDPAMASCHGSALWSYNNSNFSEEDFRNITRVGAATKELQLEKIGKFGLGFNTVYRVTDVPSILSGGSVLIFDPNACHLKKHIQSEANPGLKLNFQKHPHVLQIFKDQFHPYQNVFGCNLKDSHGYNGTLIRLPFRTEENARDSKICDQSFGAQEIELLMDTFKESSQNLIIFLKGVQEVTLGYLHPDSSTSEKETWLLKLSKNQIQKLRAPETFLLQKKLMSVTEVVTGNRVLDGNGSSIIQVTRTENSVDTFKHYLLHSSFGIMESFQTFKDSKQKNTRVDLPVAGVALPLMKNMGTGKWRPNLKDFDGQVFCFMPLPIFSGLPFHLNGSFSVMSNRKSLWDTTDKGEWNRQLLRDAVLVACVRALTQLQLMCLDAEMEDYSYHTFWPDIKKTKSVFAEAPTAFYRAVAYGIADNVLKLFSNGYVWCSIEHACFLSCDIVENRHVGGMATQVFSTKLPKPFVAVHLPEWVKAGFLESGCGDALLRNTYNWERFYKEIVFNNLNSLPVETRDALMIHAIDMNNKEVDMLLKSVSCIPSTPSGALQLIRNLVHPNSNVALLFDEEEGCFPFGSSKTYLNSQRLSRLEHLGMLKDNISVAQLIGRASAISEVWKLDRTKACCRINKMLDLLKELVQKKYCNNDQSKFRRISFLPAVLPPCDKQEANDIVLKKPTEVFHYEQSSLVNMCEPVLIKEYAEYQFTIYKDVIDFLGLRKDPSVQTVMLQMEKAQRNANMFSTQELTQMVRECYKYLNMQIRDGLWEKCEIKVKAQAFPFVLIGQEFVSLSSIARDLSFEAAPHLYQLPRDYLWFDLLWQCVGLRERFAFDDYKVVLERMARRYNGKALPTEELELALIIINTGLQGELKDNILNQYQAQGIFLPDQDAVMHPAEKLHFNDTPWLPYKDTYFCHEMIPRAVALKLRVPTKIHKTLQNLKICSLSQWASSFGAKEDLTRRIRNIIAEYSSKKDILKELIQNADDSGATELHFVWDSRTHPALRTFGDDWKSLQGPALCVYNNKVFTNKDIDGIQQLGKGGKGDKLDKTGKYGLGFNSVYHLTDCPSFVTGDSMLCVFDPNLLFLPTADENSPGGMFSINQEFKSTFTDVYNCFLPSLFHLEQGTLFRLPLRTAETVAKSQISQQTVSSHDIEALWGELEKDANDLILFLNSIQKITFSKITETDNKLQNILSIETELKGDCVDKRLAFQEKLNELAKAGQPMTEVTPFQVIYTMVIKCSSSTSSFKWMVAKQIGVQEGKFTDLQRALDSLKCTLIPHGAIAACLNSHAKGRAFCTLPLPVETGLPVHISGSFIVDSARRDICKEDGGSGKTEWNSLILTHLLAPLYSDLLEYMCQDLSQSRQAPIEFENFNACENFLNARFLRFFPHASEAVPPMWLKIIGHVYYSIFEKKLQLIPVYRLKTICIHTSRKETVNVMWSSVGQECATAEPYFIMSEIQPDMERVLHSINMKLVCRLDTLVRVFKELKRAKVKALKVCPESICNFLKVTRLYPEGDGLPLPVCDTLLKDEFSCSTLLGFCIQVANEQAEYLNDLPIMVTVDGNLGRFQRDSPKFCSRYSDLFPAHMDQFVSNNVIKPQHIALLQKEGFLKHFSIQESVCFIKEYLGHRYQILGRNCIGGIKLKTEDEKWLKRVWEYFEKEPQTFDVRNEEASSRLFKELIGYFSDCAILPVSSQKYKNETFLLNLGDCSTIVYEWSDEVAKCLSKLGFLRLNTSFVPFDIGFHCMKPHLLQTDDYSAVMNQLWSRREELHWSKITDRDADYILRFLSNTSFTPYYLQYLPLFETVEGSRQCLHIYAKKYILKTRMHHESQIFHELYQIDKQTVFLRENPLYIKLEKDLNIKVFDDLQFLVTFLLPLFTSMVEEQLLKVVKLIQKISCHYWFEFEDQKHHIFKSLRSVRFIRDRQGTLQLPSYFYDPDNLVFKTFQLYERFIPESFFQQLGYTFSQLKKTLLGLGMKTNISDDDFVEFATLVEREARGCTTVKRLKPKSKVLFSHLLQLQVEDLKNNFINRVCNICFVVPFTIISDLQKLSPSYSKPMSLVPLKGSLVKSNDEVVQLVWTSLNILKVPCAKRKLLEAFGVLFEPPTELVLENLKNVCKEQCCSKEIQTLRSKVLETSYIFLQKQLPFDSSSLASLPVILVADNALAQPHQVVLSLQEDSVFRPYLFKVPPHLAAYSHLFQNIGVETEPTVCHYARVLATIYEETKDKTSPHPNQNRTLLKATAKLFLLLKENMPTPDIQIPKPFYLPDSDGRLYDSSILVFINCNSSREISHLKGAFKFLIHLEGCSVFNDEYELEKLLKQLPEDIRPKMLSEVTTESLESMVLCTLGYRCELKGQLQGLLLSSSFQEGLASLLRAQSKGEITAEKATTECRAVFRNIEIVCCERIQTVLLKGSESLQGTSLSKDVFIKTGPEGQSQVCLVHKEEMNMRETVNIMSSLTKEVNGLMMNLLVPHSMLILLEMLTCESPEEISSVLKKHGILTRKSASQAAFSLPRPGEEIPSEWHDSLDMNILNCFKAGDYVGYMDPSGEDVYLYAIILDKLESRVCGDTEVEMFRIDLGPEHIVDVSMLDLYQFKKSHINKNNCTELEMENPEVQKEKQNKWYEKSLRDVKKEIDEQLAGIWKLSLPERKRSIRRLYLRYHPDKNIGQEELANEVCKYLQQMITILDEDKNSTSEGSSEKHSRGFSKFWSQWDQQASHHREYHEDFTRKCNHSYDFWGYHNRSQRRSRPEEAKRWFRQADCDLRAASSDVGHGSPEWVCYKVHQAIKKALIAALYKKGSNFNKYGPVYDLATKVSTFSSSLQKTAKNVSELEKHGVDNKKTQYPAYHRKPGIPNDCISSNEEKIVLEIARDILDRINEYIQQ